jgi:hypothetical protein
MKQVILKEKRRQIIAALKSNPNATQIAREVGGVNYRTVVRLAEGAGIELTAGKTARGHDRPSPEKLAKIIAALKGNPNAKQVAREIGGVSHTTVGKIAKAAGIAVAAAEYGKRLSAEKRAQIIAALKNNPNTTQIAREVGGEVFELHAIRYGERSAVDPWRAVDHEGRDRWGFSYYGCGLTQPLPLLHRHAAWGGPYGGRQVPMGVGAAMAVDKDPRRQARPSPRASHRRKTADRGTQVRI